MSAVRCPTCGWTGNRKADLPLNTESPKPCPDGHTVLVGPPPPTSTETTPSGFEIAFWESKNIETDLKQKRRYTVNEESYDSATSILNILAKPALVPAAVKLTHEGKDYREEWNRSAERGTQSHDLILRTILKERTSLADLDDEFRGWGQAAFRFLSERRPQVVLAETMVASVKHGFVGRIDLLARLTGLAGLPLIDFKSAVREKVKGEPWAENAIQLDLYSAALPESGYDTPDYGLVVRLFEDGTYDETPFLLDSSRGLRVMGARDAVREAKSALKAGLPTFNWLAEAAA